MEFAIKGKNFGKYHEISIFKIFREFIGDLYCASGSRKNQEKSFTNFLMMSTSWLTIITSDSRAIDFSYFFEAA